MNGKNENRPRLTCFATWSACFVAFTGLWQYGFSIGSINAAYVPVTKAIRRHYEERWNATISSEFVDAIWVAASAAFPVGGLFGSLLVGPIVRKFGRLHGILLGHICTVLFSLLMGISGLIGSPEVLILSRLGIGLSSGAMGTGISVMYIIEISPQHLRGAFGSTVSLGIAVGLLVSNTLGLPEVSYAKLSIQYRNGTDLVLQIFGNDQCWPLLLALTGLPSVFFLMLVKTLPESPRKLFMEDNEREKSQECLRRLNGIDDVSHIIKQMEDEKKISHSIQQMSVKQLVCSKTLRPALIAGIVMGAAQQLTGLNGVGFNMNDIYLKAGIPQEKAHYASIGVSALPVFFNIITIFLTERYGRANLLKTGYIIECVSHFLLTISIETQHLVPVMKYVAIIASIGFWIGFSVGPVPITFVIVPEFFDQATRPAGVTLSIVAMWFGFTLSVVSTPYMLTYMRGFTFLPYGIVAFLTVVFIQYKVPETKNRPFSEIQKCFQSGSVRATSTSIDNERSL